MTFVSRRRINVNKSFRIEIVRFFTLSVCFDLSSFFSLRNSLFNG